MSALHKAVVRAIVELPGADVSWRPDWDEAAAAAVGVVLAEATRSIEAVAATYDDWDARSALGEALAVLVALGDEA